jgi:hypothetical protein
LPKDPKDLPLSRCAVNLDTGVAVTVEEVWKRMLEEVQPYDEQLFGLDGVSYHFSMESNGRSLTGQAWSPRGKTRLGKLVKLVEAMRAYCLLKTVKQERRLAKLAGELRLGSLSAPR